MSIIIAEIITIIVLSVALYHVLRNAKNGYAEGALYQVKVNAFAVTHDFASDEEARAFAHAIAKEKVREGEFVYIVKTYAIGPNKNVAPIGLKAAFESGVNEYSKGYNKVTLRKWW